MSTHEAYLHHAGCRVGVRLDCSLHRHMHADLKSRDSTPDLTYGGVLVEYSMYEVFSTLGDRLCA